VTIDDVSDHSDHNEIFDLDDPPHTRTYLSPNSYEALQESRKFIPIPVPEELNTSFSSMLSHQAAEAVIESCLASMVTHQVFSSNTAVGDDGYDENQGNDEEVDHHENCELPQVDGMDDFDSDEEMQVVAAESVPVNEISESAAEVPIENFESEDVNQPEEVEGAHTETNDIVEAHTEAHEVTGAHIEAQEAAEAHVEAQEVAEARVEAQELAEAHVEAVGDNMEAIEVVGDNIQAVETVGDNIEAQEEFSLPETTEQHEAAVDLMEAAVVAGEIFSESIPHEFPVLNDAGNPPTEVSVDHEATEEQLVPSELLMILITMMKWQKLVKTALTMYQKLKMLILKMRMQSILMLKLLMINKLWRNSMMRLRMFSWMNMLHLKNSMKMRKIMFLSLMRIPGI